MSKNLISRGKHSLACACGCGTEDGAKGLSRRSVLGGLAAMGLFNAVEMDRVFAQEPRPLEKQRLKIGYLPITCTVPLLAAHAFGYFSKEGLDVDLIRTPNAVLARDRLINGEFDATQIVLPVPITTSMGVGSVKFPLRTLSILNINGSAIILANAHRDRTNPADWKGFRIGIPFEHSMHNLLLRYFLAEHGIDPDQDVTLRVTPPPECITNMQSGNIDAFITPEPFCQRAVYEGVGFVHTLSKDLLPGHPCCAMTISDKFPAEMPNTYAALFRSIVLATDFVSREENRKTVAATLAGPDYLNQPQTILEQVLIGRYADGLGKVQNEPERIDFRPQPVDDMGVWMLSQLKRWGYIKGEMDYRAIVDSVFHSHETHERIEAFGTDIVPAFEARSIMGKPFVAATP